MGDGLEEAPEERLWEGSSVPLPTPAPSLQADVLALDTVDEDGLQGTAEEVRIPVVTGDHCVRRYVSLLQGLERLRQLLLDLHVTMHVRGNISSASSFISGRASYHGVVEMKSRLANNVTALQQT